MNRVSPAAPLGPTADGRGRHRAAHRPTLARRAAVATVAVGAPLVPGALIAAPAAHAETDWDALAQCESSGNWSANTGNGFSGGLQFTPSTWKAFGGSGSPQNASREQQIAVAEKVKSAQGMTAWPVCSKKTGNTSNAANSGKSSGSTKTVSEKSSGKSSGKKSTTEKTATPKKKSTEKKVAAARIDQPAGSYTVRDGDTLSSIAAAHGTSWRAVQDGNHQVISDPNMIFPGQTLTMS